MKKISTSRTTILLMIFTLLGRITGLFREMMLSYIYGASAMSDAYVVATTFSSVIFAGIAAAILNGYVPVAVEANQKNELRMYTNGMVLTTLFLTCLLAVLLLILLHPMLSFMASGFPEITYSYAYDLSIYVILFSPLLCLINVFAGYLQIKGNFYASAMQSLATNIIMIVVFYVTVGNAHTLGMGYGFSVAVPFLIILFCAYREGYIHNKCDDVKRDDVLQTWKLIVPTLGVQLAAQINNIIDRSFASSLEEGTVSALKYAFLLCTMVVSIIAVSIGMVKFPKIAEAFNKKREDDAVAFFTSSMNSVVVIIIPIIFGMIFLAKPIIRLLFEHGAFLPSDTNRTAMLLQIYAFVILGNSFQEIISRVLMAAKKARALFFLYVGYVVLNIVLNMCFIKIWRANGLALGTTLSTIISVVVMLVYLKLQYTSFKFKNIAKPFFKACISAGVMLFVLMIVSKLFRISIVSFTGCVIYLVGSVFIGVIVYASVLLLLKEEMALNILYVIVNKGRSTDEN